MFKEMDDFVDGGVLVQNPSMAGMARVQQHYQSKGYRGVPVSLVVSIGTGIPPDRDLGCVDAQDFLSFGTHWFDGEQKEKPGNLGTLLGNAVSSCECFIHNYVIQFEWEPLWSTIHLLM